MRFPTLEAELSRWAETGSRPRLWWRDDDAVCVSPQLEKLTDLTGEAGIKVLLAVIPAHAEGSLAEYLELHPNLRACIHGWSHTNHAPAGEKKAELGVHRPLREVVADVSRGREHMYQLFGERLMPILVPPWNRVRPDLVPCLKGVGISAFSTFAHPLIEPAMQANTHVDVMDWKAAGGKRGKPLDRVIGELVHALSVSRVNGAYPIGLLTHHLVHDQTVWNVLSVLASLDEVEWCGFPIPAPPVS